MDGPSPPSPTCSTASVTAAVVDAAAEPAQARDNGIDNREVERMQQTRTTQLVSTHPAVSHERWRLFGLAMLMAAAGVGLGVAGGAPRLPAKNASTPIQNAQHWISAIRRSGPVIATRMKCTVSRVERMGKGNIVLSRRDILQAEREQQEQRRHGPYDNAVTERTPSARNPQRKPECLRTSRARRSTGLAAVMLFLAAIGFAHDLEKTRVSIVFARDGSFVADVANDPGWLKNIGEAVAENEPLIEIETDKVNVALEAPSSGYLRSVFVEAAVEVPCDTPIALVTATADEPLEEGAGATLPPASAADAAPIGQPAVATTTPTNAPSTLSARNFASPSKKVKALSISRTSIPFYPTR